MIVEINKYTFEIIEENDGENVFIKEDTMRIGLCNYCKQKIYIHSDLSIQLKRVTLAHELTHAFLFAYGFNDRELDEELICSFVGNVHEEITKIVNDYFMNGGD